MIALAPPHKNQLDNYTSWLTRRGFIFKLLKDTDSLEGCSVLMLCGGPDVSTAGTRDTLESRWFREAYGKIPVIGICRGLQLSNVLLGGTLIKDLSDEKVKHTTNKKEISGEPAPILESSWHEVNLSDGKTIKVNSRHHQGIDEVAPGLEILGTCSLDNLPELVKGDKALFVQWHPERTESWGTDAEKIVYEWLKENYKEISVADKIRTYMLNKSFSVISNERIRKSIDSSMNDEKINKLILENSFLFKKSKDSVGRKAIKLIK
jgi:GMP synthase-like glutamine amidotransferase